MLRNGYSWKKEEKILSCAGETIPLAKREILLLDFLIERIDKIATSVIIEHLLWQENVSDCHGSLSHLLKRLRKKLPQELIENVYGEGYRIHSS